MTTLPDNILVIQNIYTQTQEGYAKFLADLGRLKEMRSRIEEKEVGSRVEAMFSSSGNGLLRIAYVGRPIFTVEQGEGQTGLSFLRAQGFVCGPAFEAYVNHYNAVPDLSTTEGSRKWNWYLMQPPGDPELSTVDFLSEDQPFAFEDGGGVPTNTCSSSLNCSDLRAAALREATQALYDLTAFVQRWYNLDTDSQAWELIHELTQTASLQVQEH